MRPLLAHIYEPHRVTYPAYVQPKLNGIRALYQSGNFQSRDELPFTPGLLEHLAKPLLEVFGPEVILDGELYVHGWPLQRINAAVTPVRQQPTEDTLKVEYHIFDRVDYALPFTVRFRHDIESINPAPQVHKVITHFPSSQQRADEMYAEFVAAGYEGMMYRLGRCPYTQPKQERTNFDGMPHRTKFLSDKDNRVWHLLKRKDWQDAEFTCVAINEGEDRLAGTLGALVCFAPDEGWGHRFCVGSGFTDAQRKYFWDNPPIGKLIKVKFLYYSLDKIPQNPTLHPDHLIQ